RPGARYREHQVARSRRQRHRVSHEDRRGYRPEYGRHCLRLTAELSAPLVAIATTYADKSAERNPVGESAGLRPQLATERTSIMKRSKSYTAVVEKVDPGRVYAPSEAMAFAKANSKARFDETVDVAVRLGVDPRKADQMVRGTVNLPNGTGKTARVLVFATGD